MTPAADVREHSDTDTSHKKGIHQLGAPGRRTQAWIPTPRVTFRDRLRAQGSGLMLLWWLRLLLGTMFVNSDGTRGAGVSLALPVFEMPGSAPACIFWGGGLGTPGKPGGASFRGTAGSRSISLKQLL